jgi:hypothetical protein
MMRVDARRQRRRSGLGLALGFVLVAAPLAGQEPPDSEGELPREVALEVIEFFNRRETVRMSGDVRIAPGSELVGDMAVLGGPVSVAGRIHGRLVVINGNIRLEPGAAIEGDLTVVGGTATGLGHARISGAIVLYRAPLRFRVVGDRLEPAPEGGDRELTASREFGFGRTDLTLATHRGYNRVEGLPIVAGPRFETRGSNPTRAEALVIYRTESGLDPDLDDFGYILRLEQYVGGRRAVRLGVSLHSEVVPIEGHGLSDRENSLSTFLLHRDYRDHYERTGWTAYLRVAPRGRPLDATLEYRDERHSSLPAREPWTLFDIGNWRHQPMIAEGTLRSVAARVRFDTRNEGADPTAGWLVEASLERGLGGALLRPAFGAPFSEPDPVIDPGARPGNETFTAASIDARRYARLGPTSRLGLRALVAGSIDDQPLPPQRQHALGGEGTLPGYALFRFDCGARRVAFHRGDDVFYPYYGCDRIALFQLEYQNDFPFGHGWGRKLGWDVDLGETPGWVVFFDAGRAWNEREARDGRTDGMDDFAADAGLGLRIGRIGLYWAVPLSGRDQGVNFFIRYGSRL